MKFASQPYPRGGLLVWSPSCCAYVLMSARFVVAWPSTVVFRRPGTACMFAVGENHEDAIREGKSLKRRRCQRRPAVVEAASVRGLLDEFLLGQQRAHQPHRLGAGRAEEKCAAILPAHYPGQHLQHEPVREVLSLLCPETSGHTGVV